MKIHFSVTKHPDFGMTVEPVIDGEKLSALAERYEAERGFDVVGGYGAIVPSYFDFGRFDDYFAGARQHRYWGRVGKIALLGCSCGEIGCWPLYATVDVGAETVTWSNFEQPHRRQRDYREFGPFVFDAGDYQVAVRQLVTEVGAASELPR